MSATIHRKQGDTAPPLIGQCISAGGIPANLEGSTVVFYMGIIGQVPVINGKSVDILDAETGIVRYTFEAGELDDINNYSAEFVATHDDGSIETFPSRDYIQVRVTQEVAQSA